VGTLHHDLNLPAATFGKILRKELTLLGSWMNYSARGRVKSGNRSPPAHREKLQLKPLIAHIGDSESFAQAVQALNGAPMQGKIMLRFA
jgi:galactitol-1-phosphate 5-dehydrogenase